MILGNLIIFWFILIILKKKKNLIFEVLSILILILYILFMCNLGFIYLYLGLIRIFE